jgi:hypothetical protein
MRHFVSMANRAAASSDNCRTPRSVLKKQSRRILPLRLIRKLDLKCERICRSPTFLRSSGISITTFASVPKPVSVSAFLQFRSRFAPHPNVGKGFARNHSRPRTCEPSLSNSRRFEVVSPGIQITKAGWAPKNGHYARPLPSQQNKTCHLTATISDSSGAVKP